MSKKLFGKFFVFLLVAGLLFAVAPTRQAEAADINVACDGMNDTTDLQNAITGATNGDTIHVSGTCVLTANINVSKDVTLDGGNTAKIQVSGTGYRITMTTAGATLQGFDIEKTDKTGEQNIVQLLANNLTIQDNNFHGQFVIGDGEVSRALEIAGGLSGLVIQRNQFTALRQPAYINGLTTGTISNNFTAGTKGWVVAGGNMTFTNNTWGTVALGNPNVYDIAILSGVAPTYYTDVPAMSAANNDAFIEDQRYSTPLLTPVYVDASVPTCSDCGTARMPYDTIQEGVDRVIPGGTVHVAAGTYPEQVDITKDIILVGAGIDTSIIQAPATLPVATDPLSAIVRVHGAGVGAEITGFSISGPGPSGCGSIFAGVLVTDSAYLNLHDNKLVDIRDSGTTISGCQNGIAIFVGRNAWATTGTATIEDNVIVGYQKGAIVVDNTGSNALITGNTITGAGTTGITAQNGIQISRGATATISGNTISENSYHLDGSTWDWGATGVLLYDAGDVAFTGGNNFTGNDSHVYISGAGTVTMGIETFGASSAPLDSGYFVINYNDAPLDLTQSIFPTTDPFELAVRIWDGIDEAGNGLARFVAGNLFVTEGGSIQRAVDLATAGDTIHVGDGTYDYDTEGQPVDAGLIKITKPVTLKAADDGNTVRPVINASGLGGLTNDGVFKIHATQFQDGLVVIEGFDITGIPQTGIAITAPMYQVPGHENTIIIRDNLIHGMIGAIDFWGTTTFVTNPDPANAVVSHVEITGNKIYDMGVAGVEQGLGVMIEDPKSNADPAIYAAKITNNEFYNFVAKDISNPSAAIVLPRADAANGEDLDVLIQDNKFGAGVGVNVGIQAGTAVTGPVIIENDFSNTGIGVYSIITAPVSATPNWWGSITGPAEGQIVGNATYIPWCGDVNCVTLITPTVHNVTKNTWYLTIQAAVDAAADGNVIEVGPGTYAEAITLNKPNITVKSTDGAATTIIDVPDGTLTTGVKVLANMGTVTFDGFTVRNFTEGGIIQGMASGTGTTFHVLNNVLQPYGGYLRNGIQVSGDGSTVVGNTITSAFLTADWASTAIGVVDASNVIVSGNTITGVGDYGISAYTWEDATMSNIQILSNTITGIDYPLGVIAYNEGSVSNVDIHLNKVSGYDGAIEAEAYSDPDYPAYWGTSVTDVDATHNWWGDPLGPQGPIYGDPQIIQWCADEACETFAPVDNKITLTSHNSQVGAIKIYVPGISYYLVPGTVLQNSSPCFEVYANDVTIYTDYPAAAKCVPTNGSDGIWVADAVENLRVVNLEFDGTDQDTGSGILFSGDAVGFQVVDNYFHDLDASGVVFTGTPSGSTMDIQGNMFQDLGAAAITVPTGLEPDLNAEFNSWGVYAGATLTDVDTEPHTHADFYMTFEGDTPLEKVAIGNTIKYTVYGNLQNVSGADFTLKFPKDYLDAGTPTNLSAFVAAGPAMFTVNETAGTIRFQGDASLAPITGENLPIFEVVFTGTAAGTGAISFDQTNDAFAMFPGYGPSTWVYAAGYVDNEVEVFLDETAPTLETWTPDEGDIYLAEGEDFVLTIDALDDNLFSLEIDHNVTTLPEFTVYASASNVYGSLEAQDDYLAAGVTVTYDEGTQTWVITFESDGTALAQLLANNDVTFYAVLHDQAGKTWGSMDPTEDFNTFEYSIVFDNTAPTLESWTPTKDVTYMLTPSGDFVVTVDANDINLYELEIDNSLEPGLPQFSVYADVTDPYGGDGALFAAAGLVVTYDAGTQAWTLTFESGGDALDAIIANQGITFYAVIHDLAGNTWGTMYGTTPENTFAYTLYQQQPIARADSTGGDVVAVVSADGNTIDFTGEVDWYPADPDLGRTSGHRIGVRLSAPELDFGTSDTTFTFNGQTYDWDLVKDGDDYVLVYPKVTAEIQTWEIVVTWGGGFSQTFTVNFNGTLGPVTAYTVEGEISMQGRVARNTEDVITLDGYMLDDFTADSLDKLGINYTLSDVLTGEYIIVTNQPRYLNITADLGKSITLISDRTLPTLWLRAGNAVWSDNVINTQDAGKVGFDWGSTTNPDGNVNFDGIVNIQDLALVGGNFDLTSATAYASWLVP